MSRALSLPFASPSPTLMGEGSTRPARVPRLVVFLALSAILSIGASSAADAFYQVNGGPQHAGSLGSGSWMTPTAADWSYDPSSDPLFPIGTTGFNRDAQPVYAASADLFVAVATGASTNGASYLVAVDATTGTRAWFRLVRSFNGFGSDSSPAYSNGFVYWVGSDDQGATEVLKINASNGSTDTADGGWTVRLDPPQVVNASPTVADGKVFVSTYANSFASPPVVAQHFALDQADGSVIWSNADGGSGQGAPAYDPSRDWIYQTVDNPNGDDVLRAYQADTGTEVWTSSATFASTPDRKSVV